MPNPLSAWNLERLSEPVLRQRWLIKIGRLRLSTLYHTVYEKETYIPQDISIEFGAEWQCTLNIRDPDSLYQNRIQQGQDLSVSMLYGHDGFSDGDATEFWRGQIRRSPVRDDVIQIEGRLGGVRTLPSKVVNNETGFNHYPPQGARVIMPDGIYQFKE